MYWKVLSRIGKRSAKDTAIPDLDVHIAMFGLPRRKSFQWTMTVLRMKVYLLLNDKTDYDEKVAAILSH